jgi:hypothetical protein
VMVTSLKARNSNSIFVRLRYVIERFSFFRNAHFFFIVQEATLNCYFCPIFLFTTKISLLAVIKRYLSLKKCCLNVFKCLKPKSHV